MKIKSGMPVNPTALRTPAEKQDGDLAEISPEEETEEQLEDPEESILCRNCHFIITFPAERMMMDGLHKHTFANPHGIVFEIGCFRNAAGVAYTGPITNEFSWFKGYYWQIAVCRSCLQHLGWMFRATDLQSFHGLILDRLQSSMAG